MIEQGQALDMETSDLSLEWEHAKPDDIREF